MEDVLRKQLKKINCIRVSANKSSIFTNESIKQAILILKDLPMNEGYINACETAYNLITLGKALEQSIGGDKKNFTLNTLNGKI